MEAPEIEVDAVAMGRRITEALSRANMSAAELGRRMGLGGNTVWRWTSGKTEPSAQHLSQIAKILGRNADWYLYGQDAAVTPTIEFREVWAEFEASRAYERITDMQRWHFANLPWPRGSAPTLEYLLELARADAGAIEIDDATPPTIPET